MNLLDAEDGENLFGLAHSTFRILVENAADGMVLLDRDGAVLYANTAAAKIFGRRRDELMHVPLGRPVVDGETTQITVSRPDQAPAEVELRVVEVTWNGQLALLANLRDVSAQRAMEEQRRQQQKLEALGRLAAGIAHDFRNLIMVVQAGLRLIGNKLQDGAPATDVSRLIEEVMKRTQNAEALTSQLLTFSRRQVLTPEVVDINKRIASVASILGQTLGKGIEIHTNFDASVGDIEVDGDQFDVALLNLAVNGRDAMNGHGTLTIETGLAVNGDGSKQQSEFIRVTVRDTGVGMDPETKARAFEPFFTSKGEGKGTGLGLSQVYGFVVQSGGHVRIDSEAGAGTAVHLILPRYSDASRATATGHDSLDRIRMDRKAPSGKSLA